MRGGEGRVGVWESLCLRKSVRAPQEVAFELKEKCSRPTKRHTSVMKAFHPAGTFRRDGVKAHKSRSLKAGVWGADDTRGLVR